MADFAYVCPVCSGAMSRRFTTRDYKRPSCTDSFPLEWCSACGFGCIAGRFAPADVAAFYPDNYYTHAVVTDTSKSQSQRFAERLLVHLAWRLDYGRVFTPAELGQGRGRSACDLGCGNGNTMRALASAGFSVVGVEPDPLARQNAQQIAVVFDGTAEHLPKPIADQQFDIVLMLHVLEHCIDPRAALANVRALLSPKGTVVIEVPNNDAEGFRALGPAWAWADIPRHLQFFTEKSLSALLHQAGMTVTRILYTGYCRQFGRDWHDQESHVAQVLGASEYLNPWLLLARTAFAPPSRRYDSIRVHAVRAS